MENIQGEELIFTSTKGRDVAADFTGGQVSSDGGLLLAREVDRRLGLVRDIARRLSDPRESGKVVHENETMLRQSVMAMIAGWEDLNDAATLRTDPVHQWPRAATVRWRVRRRCAGLKTGRTGRRRGR